MLILAGALSGFVGVRLLQGCNGNATATWTAFPWLGGFLFMGGMLLLLIAANFDDVRFAGLQGRARLVRYGWVTLLVMTLAAAFPVCVAILQDRSVSEAGTYAIVGLIAARILAAMFGGRRIS